jgi:sRNA-binding regulator protein Hfq
VRHFSSVLFPGVYSTPAFACGGGRYTTGAKTWRLKNKAITMQNRLMTEDVFLTQLVNGGKPGQYFLCSGVKLMGVLENFDSEALFVRRSPSQGGGVQMVYKLAVASVSPCIVRTPVRSTSEELAIE